MSSFDHVTTKVVSVVMIVYQLNEH